jgi:hypothetical protein
MMGSAWDKSNNMKGFVHQLGYTTNLWGLMVDMMISPWTLDFDAASYSDRLFKRRVTETPRD